MKTKFLSLLLLAFAAAEVNAQSWSLTGNAGTNPSTNFIGTTDAKSFRIRTNNQVRLQITNTGKMAYGAGSFTPAGWFHIKGRNNETQLIIDAAVGQSSSNPLLLLRDNAGTSLLWLNSDHPTNTFLGLSAGAANNSTSLTSEGKFNTFIGRAAGLNNTFGAYNTALGDQSLSANENGTFNTAIGDQALTANTIGDENVAVGAGALAFNTSADGNVAVGYLALNVNTDRIGNTAVGYRALSANGTGQSLAFHSKYNTALGYEALLVNNLGDENVGLGFRSQYSGTTGFYNTSVGSRSLYFNQTGVNNVALGYQAGYGLSGVNIDNSSFVGSSSSVTVNRSNVHLFGFNITNAQVTASNQVVLGNTAITQIRAQVSGITAFSDARYKTNVKEDVKGLDFISRLRPVSYNVNPDELHKIWGTPDSAAKRNDHSETRKVRYTGLIAQEVEKAMEESGYPFTGIDIPTNDKETYALRYTEFIMPLIKSVQEQQAMIEKLQEQNEQLQAALNRLEGNESRLQSAGSSNGITAVAPNPVSDRLTVSYSISRPAEQVLLCISDLNGRLIKSMEVQQTGKTSIDIPFAELSAGIYNLALVMDGTVTDSRQVVKQ